MASIDAKSLECCEKQRLSYPDIQYYYRAWDLRRSPLATPEAAKALSLKLIEISDVRDCYYALPHRVAASRCRLHNAIQQLWAVARDKDGLKWV